MQRYPALRSRATHCAQPSVEGRPRHADRDGSIQGRLAQPQLHLLRTVGGDGAGGERWPGDVGREAFGGGAVVAFDRLTHEDFGAAGLGDFSGGLRSGSGAFESDDRRGRSGDAWRVGQGTSGGGLDCAREVSKQRGLRSGVQCDEAGGAPNAGNEDAIGGDEVDVRSRSKVGCDGVQDGERPRFAASVAELGPRVSLDEPDDASRDGTSKPTQSIRSAWQSACPTSRRYEDPVSKRHARQSRTRRADA